MYSFISNSFRFSSYDCAYDPEINGDCVPESVTHLLLGETNDLPKLPSSLIYLEINNDWPFSTVIPVQIKYLWIGTLSKYVVPDSVTHLSFYNCEEAFIDCIPSSVTYLEFQDIGVGDIESLPSSIT